MMVAIEHHVEWISDCLQYMGVKGYTRIEASVQAEVEWVQHVNQVANDTLCIPVVILGTWVQTFWGNLGLLCP